MAEKKVRVKATPSYLRQIRTYHAHLEARGAHKGHESVHALLIEEMTQRVAKATIKYEGGTDA